MPSDKFSKQVQDYVKTIYALQHELRPVSNGALKAKLSEIEPRSAAAVTEMIQTLVKLNLVSYEPYQGVALTAVGERVALEVVRHHRLIELYLFEALGMPLDEVHAEAEQLEHALSANVTERMVERLGQPQYDPHGAPISARPDCSGPARQSPAACAAAPPAGYRRGRRCVTRTPALPDNALSRSGADRYLVRARHSMDRSMFALASSRWQLGSKQPLQSACWRHDARVLRHLLRDGTARPRMQRI